MKNTAGFSRIFIWDRFYIGKRMHYAGQRFLDYFSMGRSFCMKYGQGDDDGNAETNNKESPISFLDSMIAISFIIYFKGITAQMVFVRFGQKIGG